jgi:hypothetical protein
MQTLWNWLLRSELNGKNRFRSHYDDDWLSIPFHIHFQRTIISASLRADYFGDYRNRSSYF